MTISLRGQSGRPVAAPRDAVAADRRRSVARGVAAVVCALVVLSVYAVHDGGTTLYVQRVIDGTTNGVLYGAVAVALVLIFKATRVINFSQGAMATMGAFVAFSLHNSWSFPLWLAVLAAMAVSAAGAAVIERTLIRPFDPNNHLAIVIVTLGLYIALNAATAFIWGFNPRGFPSLFPNNISDYVQIAGARLYYAEIGTAVLLLLTVVVIEVVLARTRLGLAMRCVANSVEGSRLLGINVGRSVQVSWALAAAAGTLAGCLVAPDTYIEPGYMDKVLVFSFAAATLGGLDSVIGAPIAGIFVGLSISLITGYFPTLGSEFALPAAFLMIIAVLQLKPAGLFGRRYLERV